MPRYYFNMVDGGPENLVRDTAGALFPDLVDARKEAEGLARDFAKHGFKGPEKWKVVVCDQDGKEVLIVQVRERGWRERWMWLDLRRLIAKLKRSCCTPTFVGLSATAISAILVQVAVTTAFITQRGGSYQIASAPIDESIVAVRFVPHASGSDITNFLEAYKASLVGGPQPGGFYRVRIAEKILSQEEITKLMVRLAQEEIVDLAAAMQ